MPCRSQSPPVPSISISQNCFPLRDVTWMRTDNNLFVGDVTTANLMKSQVKTKFDEDDDDVDNRVLSRQSSKVWTNRLSINDVTNIWKVTKFHPDHDPMTTSRVLYHLLTPPLECDVIFEWRQNKMKAKTFTYRGINFGRAHRFGHWPYKHQGARSLDYQSPTPWDPKLSAEVVVRRKSVVFTNINVCNTLTIRYSKIIQYIE